MKTFIIDYRVFCKSGTYHPPKMKVKNCQSELSAKIKLEKYIEPKYEGYLRMEIISCESDMVSDIFNLFRR